MYTIKFYAYVSLGGGVDKMKVPFYLKTKNKEKELSLSWDMVYEAAVEEMEKKYSYSDFPKMEVSEITIIDNDEEFPVLAEDYDKNELESKKVKKALVLPYEVYSLVPEFKKYLELSEAGLINFEYSFEKMKNFLEMVRK